MILKILLTTQMIWMISIKNPEKCNSNNKRKILIGSHDMIADMNYLLQVES